MGRLTYYLQRSLLSKTSPLKRSPTQIINSKQREHFKMKNLLIVILLSPLFSFAQNRSIKGNGNQISIKKTLVQFSKIKIDLLADVEVKVGEMPMVELSGDANIIRRISTNIKDNTLNLEIKDGFWFQGAKPKIIVYVPFLSTIITDGKQTNIGMVNIYNIDVSNFEVNQVYGNITLEGKTENLVIKSSNRSFYQHSGTLDARGLITKSVNARIQGSNEAMVYCTETLNAELEHDAKLKYEGEPKDVKIRGNAIQKEIAKPTKQNANTEKLKYVSVEIKNNSAMRRHFKIKGPNGRGGNFSYGFPLNPFESKKEKIPVGTKFYSNKSGKILVKINLDDEGKIVQLFK